MDVDVDAYLGRIDYRGSREPTLATLRDLHLAHLRTVPFENLDIPLGRPIVLDPRSLERKIVEGRRGGYCCELNGLFALLLRGLGFRVDMLSAGVAKAVGEGFTPEFDHMTLQVRLEEPWLADVGFGELFLGPLRLEARDEQPDGGKGFRITEDGPRRILWSRDDHADWNPEYRFTLLPRRLDEFEPRNRWMQTSPESHFTQNAICSRVTPEGRITLSGSRLIVTTGRERSERVLTDAERTAVLRDSFGIEL
ncbi:MAG TPA: arylamine N-acetyltransferase [Thermoplasmata archaeon]|nr:arylamine N-acetyltransferase [Thermoplasmata archaeon]